MSLDPGGVKPAQSPYIDPNTPTTDPTPSEGAGDVPVRQGPGNRMDEGAWGKMNFNVGQPKRSQSAQSLGPEAAGGEMAFATTDVKTQVTVGPNDTLKGLADKYGVSEKEIIRANPGKEAKLEAIQQANPPNPKADIDHTMLGQKLNIPNPQPMKDRALDALSGGFRSRGDREINAMNDTAARISQPRYDGQPGPAANWSPQQRLNFARGRTEMQQEGKSLKEIVGEKALPETLTHLGGDLAAGGIGAEGALAAGAFGLAITAGGELMVGTMGKMVSGNTDEGMATDLENLRKDVQQNGSSALDASRMLQDGRYTGKLISGGGDPKPYIASLVLLYQATFGK
jgi:LysM repeat protein